MWCIMLCLLCCCLSAVVCLIVIVVLLVVWLLCHVQTRHVTHVYDGFKKTISVIEYTKITLQWIVHYGFTLFENMRHATNYEYYGFN